MIFRFSLNSEKYEKTLIKNGKKNIDTSSYVDKYIEKKPVIIKNCMKFIKVSAWKRARKKMQF